MSTSQSVGRDGAELMAGIQDKNLKQYVADLDLHQLEKALS